MSLKDLLTSLRTKLGNTAIQKYREELNDLLPKLDIEKKLWDGEFKYFDWRANPLSDSDREFKRYKISICTTCMDRLKDLKITLPENIQNNLRKTNVEFVVLDYNSTKDDIGAWIKSEMMEYIERGTLVYCRTEDPKHYSMTKSRNLAFKCASGDIVCNVDADSFTNKGFAWYTNRLANEMPERAIFAKGRRMLRGRLGFWRKEFIDNLGGYDETIDDYGHDDWDLMDRAWALGFTLMWFGGRYFAKTSSRKHGTENMYNPRWKETEARNKVISTKSLLAGKFKSNEGVDWGRAHIVKNFKEEFDL